MAHDPFSFDINLPRGSSAAAATTRRYIAPPFDARLLSDQEATLLVSRQQHSVRLPVSSARILGACDRFGTLDELAQHVAGRLRVPPTQTGGIARELQDLADRGLLQSEDDVHRRLLDTGSADHTAQPIETLFIRTCNRPDTLARLLESLAAQGEHSGLKHCAVLDDSRGEAGDQTAAVIADYRNRLPLQLHHVGRQQRRSLIAAIASGCDCDIDRLRWLIEGDDDDSEPGYGISLNLALLVGAGERFAIMDDDASLDAYRIDGTNSIHRFTPTPSVRLVFPEPHGELSGQFEALTTSPVSEHARYLGLDGAGFARLGDDDRVSLYARVDPQLLFDLHAPTRIRITSNGTLGDPGTSGIHWLFAEPADHLAPLCASEQRYRELVGQRRVARSPDSIQASSAFSLMTTTLTGIDNRELLLPTQARGGNEDLMFGALVTWLHPGSLHAGMPHMLLHMRPQPRCWDLSEIDRPRSTNRGRFLATQLNRLGPNLPAGDVDHRVSLLGAWLESLASSRTEELRWRLQQDLLDLRGDTIERIRNRLAELSPPEWLAADFRRSLKAHSQEEDADHQRLDQLALDLPRFARHYAAGLKSWCQAWRYCSTTDTGELLTATARQDDS